MTIDAVLMNINKLYEFLYDIGNINIIRQHVFLNNKVIMNFKKYIVCFISNFTRRYSGLADRV